MDKHGRSGATHRAGAAVALAFAARIRGAVAGAPPTGEGRRPGRVGRTSSAATRSASTSTVSPGWDTSRSRAGSAAGPETAGAAGAGVGALRPPGRTRRRAPSRQLSHSPIGSMPPQAHRPPGLRRIGGRAPWRRTGMLTRSPAGARDGEDVVLSAGAVGAPASVGTVPAELEAQDAQRPLAFSAFAAGPW